MQMRVGRKPIKNLFFKQEKDPIFFDRLHESLQILSEFFFADGRGIMGPKLYTPNFNRLDIEFSLNGVREGVN